MKSKSLVMVAANAKAKPAREALMLGVMRHARPVAAVMIEEMKLSRMDSHRLTGASKMSEKPDGEGGLDITHFPIANSKDWYSTEDVVRSELL
jgi:hypothetical protein